MAGVLYVEQPLRDYISKVASWLHHRLQRLWLRTGYVRFPTKGGIHDRGFLNGYGGHEQGIATQEAFPEIVDTRDIK